MKLLKSILATAVMGSILFTTAYANYEFGNMKHFYSFEEYEYQYNGSAQPEPEGFIWTGHNSYKGKKGYHIDTDRQSKTYRLAAYNNETVLKFGQAIDSGMLHLSWDMYQDYNDANPVSKGKTIMAMLQSNVTESSSTGWYHGNTNAGAQIYDQYDPEAINFDRYQHFFNSGLIDEWGDDENPMPNHKGPMYYHNAARSWGGSTAYDPTKVIDWRQWYKLDIFIDKDNATYQVYLNGELVEGRSVVYNKGIFEYKDPLAATMDTSERYKATKALVFRAITTSRMSDGVRVEKWRTNGDGHFLLDNIYAKAYTGDKDIISLATDDLTGSGVALINGTLNVGYSEYMAAAAQQGDITIKNVLTGDEITDFTISNSDGMQFLIQFGSTPLEPGQYTVEVANITGKISGETVALPAYFNTVKDGHAWVNDVKCLRIDGVGQERGRDVTSATTAVLVEFTEPVNMTDETAGDYFILESGGKEEEISRFVVSADKKSVVLYPKNLFLPDSESKITVLNTLTTESGAPFVRNQNGNLAEEIISVANDPLNSYGQEFAYDSNSQTANFSVDVIKSDESEIQYTMAVASYKDVADSEGNLIPRMLDIKYVPIFIQSSDRVLKEYITENINCAGADRVKAFIWEYPSFKNIYTYEEEL